MNRFTAKNFFKASKFGRGIAAALLTAPLLFACATHQPASSTVAQAVAAPDDSKVVITGAVVQQIDKEHLLIRDATGQITVEVDDDVLGEVQFAPDAEVRVFGTIDRDSERSVLVAKTVQVVQ
ncbi:MAG: NirD/YgiW/YdeI family stress tolerance protein [Spongiibacteraceae bacterium]